MVKKSNQWGIIGITFMETSLKYTSLVQYAHFESRFDIVLITLGTDSPLKYSNNTVMCCQGSFTEGQLVTK